MRNRFLVVLALLCAAFLNSFSQSASQPTRGWLTVETIMRDPAWMGTSPGSVYWSEDGSTVYFNWRREGDLGDSLYSVDASGGRPKRVPLEVRRTLPSRSGDYTRDWTRKAYIRDGDIFVLDIKKSREVQLTRSIEAESNARFAFDEGSIVFERDGNLFKRNLSNGLEEQITNFSSGTKPSEGTETDLQHFVRKESLALSDVLRKRREDKERKDDQAKSLKQKSPGAYYLGQKTVFGLTLSPDERHVTFVLTQQAQNAKRTIVPNYVTESGFTEDIPARTKVGEPLASYELAVLDRTRDTVIIVKPGNLPGIMTVQQDSAKEKPRPVRYTQASWSNDGKTAFLQIFSQDNKDRWIVILDPKEARLGPVLDHQHDEAWIGGPGIGFFGGNTVGWMPDSKSVYFQSEADGWSHLYVVGADGTRKRQLTKGSFEVYGPQISRDKKQWYFSSNEVHFGERHFYSMLLEGGARTRRTGMEGRSDIDLSPDEKSIAIMHSFSNRMPELYLMDNRSGARPVRITESPSVEFRSYAWRAPQVLRMMARDGAEIPARLYKPGNPNGAAVIFVHGAGYLQNAHKWWSSYFREYMFHNLLADKGYTVLDLDYRASAGLGRDWRTGIYRHMGGKDLDDQIDGARWLAENHGVDPKRIGMYGGSYGGFITLMALFTAPDVFAAGAALRPVTDWAHYNHGYTSAILNIPQEDTLAFRRSSPIYHAEGLKGALLICHGMVDVNVHYQDAVRLVQRLIELKKENWEFASYPVEDHGFKEETSWMDEYKRILKLFEENLVR
ncbi:MAG: prolyl oligopeptidase family serine peptidase [Bacteroidota bacterium]